MLPCGMKFGNWASRVVQNESVYDVLQDLKIC